MSSDANVELDEKLANIVAEIPPDSPNFWNHVNKQIKASDKMATDIQGLMALMTAVLPLVPQEHNTQCFATMKDFFVKNASGYDDFADVLGVIATQRQKMDGEVLASVNAHLTSFVEHEVAPLKAKETSYKQTEEQYFVDLKKYHHLKPDTDPAVLRATSQQCSLKKNFLDLQRYDLDGNVRELDDKRQLAALKFLSEIMNSTWNFFKTGFELFEQQQVKLAQLNNHVQKLQRFVEAQNNHRRAVRRQLEKDKFATLTAQRAASMPVPQSLGVRDQLGQGNTGKTISASKEGHLFLPVPDWVPVFCRVQKGMFSVYKPNQRPEHMDLLLCSVREQRELSLLHCFQIITPVTRITFQAAHHEDMQEWMNVIQSAISEKLNSQPSSSGHISKAKTSVQLQTLQNVPGNRACVDCGAKDPDWVSINLGVLMCLECSGVHRAMGVHLSKVRSLTLDVLDASLLKYLSVLGNARSNALLWEEKLYRENQDNAAAVDQARQAIIRRDGKESWIRSKYERREHIISPVREDTPTDLNQMLFSSLNHEDPLLVLKFVACGADLNWHNEEQEQRTVLHQAVQIGKDIFIELLLQNGALSGEVDIRGWTPLHYASYYDDQEVVSQLLARGAKLSIKDTQNRDPFDVATEFKSQACLEKLLKAREISESKQNRNHNRGMSSVEAPASGVEFKKRESEVRQTPPDLRNLESEILARKQQAESRLAQQKTPGIFDRLFNFGAEIASTTTAEQKQMKKVHLEQFLARRPSSAVLENRNILLRAQSVTHN